MPTSVPPPTGASPRSDSTPRPDPTPYAEYERAVAVYTAAGGQETVQRVVTAISRVSRGLDVYYRQQLNALGVSHGEWTVLSSLALEGRSGSLTPSKLADICGVSPSTMTHRLDRMAERGLLTRATDPDNRTRSQIALASAGWELFRRAVLDADVVEARIVAPLDATERRQLAVLLERLVAGLRVTS
jgi:DNA-binding MarR family transcriptional regulator